MRGSFEIARSFVAVSLLAACRLDASAKTGCVTTADCVAPHVCIRSTCVAPDANTALTTAMCGALPPSEILSVVPGRAGPQWQAARVDLPATSSCAYMDETEVTVAEYGAWVDASGGFTDWDSRCVPWKTTVSDPERSPSDACVMAIPAESGHGVVTVIGSDASCNPSAVVCTRRSLYWLAICNINWGLLM